MHVTLRSQEITTGPRPKPSIMCVERDIHTCIILYADPEKVDSLVAMARSMGVDRVLMLAPDNTIRLAELRDEGWHMTDIKVLSKVVNGT